MALADEDCSANTVVPVADVLGRLGWLADEDCVFASDELFPVIGAARDGMMRPKLSKRLGIGLAARMHGEKTK